MLGGRRTPLVPQKGLTPMAKKADLLAEAKTLGLEVTEKNTIAEIEAAIAAAPAAENDTALVELEREEVVAEKADAKLAKAGKRSAKALAEAEEKAEKEARKEAGDTTPLDENAEAHVAIQRG